MDVIDNINALLAQNGMTGADLCREIGVSSGVYSQWNTRQTKPSKKSIKMAMIGHSAMSMTMEYTHADLDGLKKIAVSL